MLNTFHNRITDADGLKSMRYYPNDGIKFKHHFDMEDLADFHDNPTDTGASDEEYIEETHDNDADKGYITIGHFHKNIPTGNILIFGIY